MLRRIKDFLLSHEPWRPSHIGLWIRTLYFQTYFFRHALSVRSGRILDAGCGRGTYAASVARRFPQAEVQGYDILGHKEWHEYILPNLTFRVQDLRELTEREVFDAIISIDSLEHIPDNRSVLAAFFNALNPGGILYIAVPSEQTEMHIFPRRWFSRFHEWEHDEHVGEQRTRPALAALLVSLGFEPLVSRDTFTFWGILAWEVETLLSWGGPFAKALNVVLMPLYKLLGVLDVYLPLGTGNVLLIARKPAVPASSEEAS